ncbi:MAG: hypothetical protein AABX47_05900 [Nanoarchaeota archaeon]
MPRANTTTISEGGQDPKERLSYSDGHAHAFSRCVYNYRQTPPTWNEFLKMSLNQKLCVLEANMTEIIWMASLHNMEYQAITDHAYLFSAARITYDQYRRVLNKSIAKLDRLGREANKVFIMPGVELNVKVAPGKEPYIDLEEICYGLTDPYPALNRMKLIIASVHDTDIKDRQYISTEGYLELLKANIKGLSQIWPPQQRKGRVLICGHPWDAACRINSKTYDSLARTSTAFKSAFPTPASFELFCPDAPIPYFNQHQLDELSRAFTEGGVIPELNLFQIYSRRAEVRRSRPYHPEDRPPILEAYLAHRKDNNLEPEISIGSDAHVIGMIGKHFALRPRFAEILEQVPNLRNAITWGDRIKRSARPCDAPYRRSSTRNVL